MGTKTVETLGRNTTTPMSRGDAIKGANGYRVFLLNDRRLDRQKNRVPNRGDETNHDTKPERDTEHRLAWGIGGRCERHSSSSPSSVETVYASKRPASARAKTHGGGWIALYREGFEGAGEAGGRR